MDSRSDDFSDLPKAEQHRLFEAIQVLDACKKVNFTTVYTFKIAQGVIKNG
ncbi:hypothetical protein ACQKK5_25390 [Brevibacillus panacihumi]|uniref:hypothetical protein n=1 Tax=Brevibacillus panacihumi TaxID=497735 RepID=UPI003CFE8F07